MQRSRHGTLVIDYNATSPTYHGSGVIVWPATLTAISGDCEGVAQAVAGGAYFGGHSGFAEEAAGSVSNGGSTIEGSDLDASVPPIQFRWRFTRDP